MQSLKMFFARPLLRFADWRMRGPEALQIEAENS